MEPLFVDTRFLQTLLYTGVFSLYVDGLNEASVAFRVELAKFRRVFKRTQVLITTQPIDWQLPESATTVVLLPLEPEQRQEFLSLCYDSESQLRTAPKGSFMERCSRFVSAACDHAAKLSAKHCTAVEAVFSNPMDLTVCAQLIAEDVAPDFLRLQQQQVDLMADDFVSRVPGSDSFPTQPFAEAAYRITVHPYAPALSADTVDVPKSLFAQATSCMSRHRLVIPGAAPGEWRFRHDKIRDYFVLQTFMGDSNPRPEQHIGDSRFSGVYFLLAYYLPSDAAVALRETLIEYAFANNDFAVSRSFVEGLQVRRLGDRDVSP